MLMLTCKLQSNGVCEDSMYRYCTEGTPANISHAGSHSDLSVLSFPNEIDEDLHHDHTGTELSDDSSTFSGDNENILAECIQSGMPKVCLLFFFKFSFFFFSCP